MTSSSSIRVLGIHVDAQTRCEHYRSHRDIIAIKMKCCGEYYACKDCHDALAGHPTIVWPREQWDQAAVLCGVCRAELSIHEYLESGNRCPKCNAEFNPNCSRHYHFYFESVP